MRRATGDIDMNKRFLDFVELAPRSRKPRERGLSTFGDRGYPLDWIRGMLEAYGEYIDVVKFTPTCLLAPWGDIEKKVQLYRVHGVGVGTDDPIFAISYLQGKAQQLMQTLREVGFTHVQIDTRQAESQSPDATKRADEDERRYFALARDLTLKVIGEIGKKWPKGDSMRAGKGSVNVSAAVSETKRLLTLGCEHVYLESRVIRDAIGDYGEREEGTRQIREIVEAVGSDKVFIEISGQIPFDTRQSHRFWAVRNFGPEVNMGGGGSIEEARYVEAIRRGITFVGGPARSTSKLWIKSLAAHGGKAAPEWWKEEYELDASLLAASKTKS
jgi:phosphosulfolactate synthase (CoM biosynthesis protein A)